MDRVPNAQIRELCGVRKGLDERIEEGVLQWSTHVERMERDRIAKRVNSYGLQQLYEALEGWNSVCG